MICCYNKYNLASTACAQIIKKRNPDCGLLVNVIFDNTIHSHISGPIHDIADDVSCTTCWEEMFPGVEVPLGVKLLDADTPNGLAYRHGLLSNPPIWDDILSGNDNAAQTVLDGLLIIRYLSNCLSLYRIDRTDNVDYDEYDSIIVAETSATAALTYNPGGDKWPLDCLECTRIGTAEPGSVPGIIHSSFNAG